MSEQTMFCDCLFILAACLCVLCECLHAYVVNNWSSVNLLSCWTSKNWNWDPVETTTAESSRIVFVPRVDSTSVESTRIAKSHSYNNQNQTANNNCCDTAESIANQLRLWRLILVDSSRIQQPTLFRRTFHTLSNTSLTWVWILSTQKSLPTLSMNILCNTLTSWPVLSAPLSVGSVATSAGLELSFEGEMRDKEY